MISSKLSVTKTFMFLLYDGINCVCVCRAETAEDTWVCVLGYLVIKKLALRTYRADAGVTNDDFVFT